MCNTIFIKNKMLCVRPMGMRNQAIQRLHLPTIPKGCQSFAGVVNFLSQFFPELQWLLKPMYNLTRKARICQWLSKQQEASDKIK